MTIDENKLNEFMNKVVGDVGAAMSAALVVVGDRLGLYKAMAASGPVKPAQLAVATGTKERYVREWLDAQTCGGYVAYDAKTGTYALPPEQAFALAEDLSPASCPGSSRLRARCGAPSTRRPRTSARAPASHGAISTRASSRAPRGFSGPATSATWSARGSRPSMA